MEVQPRPKTFRNYSNSIPTIQKTSKAKLKIKGVFNGVWVYVDKVEDIKIIVEMGCFGKPNFSRSHHQFNDEIAEIVRARQYDKRMEWTKKKLLKNTSSLRKILIVHDSDGDYEDYFKNLVPSYELDRSGLHEVLCLTLEEAFFLASSVETLEIWQELQRKLNTRDAWKLFSESDVHFVSNYVVFDYFRSKNWIVKPGMKFGGDFLLYKEGPAYYHASYVVIIDVFDENSKRIDKFMKRSMDKLSLLCLSRLCQTTGKELMICEVTLPENIDFDNLKNVLVKEILVNRFNEVQD